jgi:uncharacterized protein (TIGR02246 family)
MQAARANQPQSGMDSMSHVSKGLGVVVLVVFTAIACSDTPVEIANGAVSASQSQARMNVSGSPGDLAAIQQIVNTFDQAWTAGDGVAYAAQYANVIEWVGPNGAILTDPAAITNTYVFILSVVLPNTTRQSTIRRVTFLTGTTAVLDIDARVTGFAPIPGLEPWQPGIIRAQEKNVLEKRGGKWQIILHQQTFNAPGT